MEILKTLKPKAAPFVKWVGGKRQIVPIIEQYQPLSLATGTTNVYVEPFVGGGAIFFYFSNQYQFKEKYIIDINPELILVYKTIQKKVEVLIASLQLLEGEYLSLVDESRKKFYYEIRDQYNKKKNKFDYSYFHSDWIKRASQFIFLNRTCYNGLYRVNSKGEFNVPAGSYKNPKICDPTNLLYVAKALEKTIILQGDFSLCEQYVTDKTFLYFDPPYRPISKTSSFNSYSKDSFDDKEQKRLAEFCRRIDSLGAKFLLSNSDPKNYDQNDDFFDVLYEEFEIRRIEARRNINSKGGKRGPVSELLIMNYLGIANVDYYLFELSKETVKSDYENS